MIKITYEDESGKLENIDNTLSSQSTWCELVLCFIDLIRAKGYVIPNYNGSEDISERLGD